MAVFTMETATKKQVRIVVKNWIAQDRGIPVCIDATIERETERAYLVNGHATADAPICCARCGEDLTHPASRLVGVGPICAGHWNIPYPSRDVSTWTTDMAEAVRAKVREIRVNCWIPKSAVKQMEVLGTVQVETPVRPVQQFPTYRVTMMDGLIFYRCRFEDNDRAKAVPGCRFHKTEKAWYYPATPSTATTLLRVVRSQDEVHPDVVALASVIGEAAKAKKSNDLPDHPSKTPSWMHQRQAYEFAKDLPAVGLFMDMGTGKTKVAVDLIANRGHRLVLVVCPKSAIEDVWQRQIPQHSAVDMEVVLLQGTSEKRIKLVQEAKTQSRIRPVVMVCNYEAIWRDPLRSELVKAGLDCVVLDESHRIKSPGSKVSMFCAELGRKVHYRLAMTGTPAHNNPLDVYAQYRFLDPGVFGTSFVKFRDRYATMGGYGGYQVLEYRNQEEMANKMYTIAFRVRTDDVLDLPEEMDQERTFNLSPSARRIYNDLHKDMVADVGGGKVTVGNALTRLLRMQQITSGHLPVDGDEERVLEVVDTGKKELLAEIVEDLPVNEPLVVFCRFVHDMENVREVAEAAGRRYYELSGRRNDLQSWKDEEGGVMGVIAVQIRSGGAGVDLTKARYAVYYSLGFSLGDYDQSRRRINRPGQTRSVCFYHFIARNTVDGKVYEALRNKTDVVSYVVDNLRS